MKKTTFNITSSLLELENEILKNIDIPRTLFHRRAIDYYLLNGNGINERLLIKKRSDPRYVIKDEMEQIYLDPEREEKLKDIGKKYNCGITTVLFQVLLDYCCLQAPIVLGNMEKLYED